MVETAKQKAFAQILGGRLGSLANGKGDDLEYLIWLRYYVQKWGDEIVLRMGQVEWQRAAEKEAEEMEREEEEEDGRGD
jgi:hypothetical protein